MLEPTQKSGAVMEDNKTSSNDVNKNPVKENNIQSILKQFAGSFIEGYRKIYNLLPKEWVLEQDELIQRISGLSWEKCDALVNACLDALEILEGKDPIQGRNLVFNDNIRFSNKSRIRDWQELFDIARKRNYETLQNLVKEFGVSNFILGYWLMFALAQKRLELYADENPNERAVIYIHNAKLLQKHGFLSEIKDSYQKLLSFDVVKKAETNWKELTDDERLKLSLIYQCLHLAIQEALKNTPIENQIMIVANGDKRLRYIPHAVFCDVTNEFKKEDTYKQKSRSLDNSLTDESDETFKDVLKDEEEDDPEKFFLKMLETQKLTEKIIYLKELLKLLSEPQRKAVTMRFEGFKFEEIGKELGIKRQTAFERYNRGFNNLRKAFIKKYPSLDT